MPHHGTLTFLLRFRLSVRTHPGGLKRLAPKFVRWVGTAKEAAHVLRCAPEQVHGIHPVGQEPAGLGKIAIGVDFRNTKPRGERNDELTMHGREVIRHQGDAASRFTTEFRDRIFNLSGVVHFRDDRLYLVFRRGLHERAGKKRARIRYRIRIVHQGYTASCATISFNSETYFPAMLAFRMVNPVMLPPGRAMLATNPLPIGSETDTKTMGNVRVACISAVTTGVLWPTMQSGLSSTSPFAKACMRAESPLP